MADKLPRSGESADGYPTYYNQPAIRAGHWGWLIIGYFWAGGIAGGSYLLAAVARLFGSEEDQEISRWGRYLAFLFGAVVSPILLVLDLGKPERFYNMLRIFKPRSVMSVGSWGLSFFGIFTSLSTLIQASRDGLLGWLGPVGRVGGSLPSKPIEAVGSLFGLFMGGYTGVLISQTAVPLWARNHKTNGPLFLASALATASAAISLLMALTGRGTRSSEKKLAAVQRGAILTEGALLAYELKHLGPLREPLIRGKAAPFFYASLLQGVLLPLLIGLPQNRWFRILKALFVLAGGFCLRAAIIFGGKESGRRPRDYFWFTDPEGGHKA